MPKNQRSFDTLSDVLRRKINDSPASFKELERETGVKRQSLMRFARGEGSLRLDMADKLAKYFQLELRSKKER
ncbi:MAG: helix-turn-helix transcriptional regulator [Lacipirellulaceae bacterium]